MRLRNHLFFASIFAIGCGGVESADLYTPPDGNGGSAGSGGPGGFAGQVAQPEKLSDDAVVVVGVTDDDQAVYRNSKGLVAIRLDRSESEPRMISDKGGTVQIRGKVVFLFSDVDWTTNLGELTVWTAETGAKSAGIVMYGEDTALASSDGSWIAFMNNVSDRTADLVVATPDLATQHVLVAGVGRGSEDTCRAIYGFVQDRMFAASCVSGERNATLRRFQAPDWTANEIATSVNTLWSADTSGSRVFYTDPSSGGWFVELGNPPVKIDAGVGWGTLVPDGSAVLYTVSDQLRRTGVPTVAPTPVIATKFAARAAWSSSYSHSLYSTIVTYENGTRRDLRLTSTDGFNPAPVELVSEPKAEISRSAFTKDGKWVIYLTDAEAGKKSMSVQSIDGGEPIAIDDADTALAAHGSRIVFSSNRSDPERYPITADLMAMDPAFPGKPLLMQSGTTDGRAYHVSSDGSKLVYVMPAGPGAPAGVWVQAVP
jgi:hypothetical protein